MDAFESLVAMLLKREGYWTTTSFKVELTKSDKQRIERHSNPRWEIDVVAYKGATNEVLAVECKSFLDSPGVKFRNGVFEPERRYKLFTDRTLRRVVLKRLARQLVARGLCRKRPRLTLCLAVGHIANITDRGEFEKHLRKHRWRLFDERWLLEKLNDAAISKYENDVAHVVAKLISRTELKKALRRRSRN